MNMDIVGHLQTVVYVNIKYLGEKLKKTYSKVMNEIM